MRNLVRTRRSWKFKARTPAALLGKRDPETGRPFGAHVARGLGTTDARLASAKAAILRGELARLALSVGSSAPDLSDDAALRWADAIKAQAAASGSRRPRA